MHGGRPLIDPRIVRPSSARLGQWGGCLEARGGNPMLDRTPADVNSPLFPVGTRLLAFARELQRAATFVEVLDVARAEVRDAIGFDHAWLCVADEEDAREVRMLGYSGSRQDLVWDVAPRIPVTGDPMMEEIFAADGPVIVE